MLQNLANQEADDTLRAVCEPLLERIEARPDLLPLIEPELRAILLRAGRNDACSRILVYRLDKRLRDARFPSLPLAPRKPRHG
jgi:hypothetical protein